MDDCNIVKKNKMKYGDAEKYLQTVLAYNILGCYMEAHSLSGKEFLKIVYKDVIGFECKKKGIEFCYEKKYDIKGIIPSYCCFDDFFVKRNKIPEVKLQQVHVNEQVNQVLNYWSVSDCIELLVYVREGVLKCNRLILQ